MDVTYYQTAELRLDNTYRVLQAYAPRPVMPFAARENGDVKVVSLDGTKTYWYESGTIRQESPMGYTLVFPVKPSFEEAFHRRPVGAYYEFHKDGAVTFQQGQVTQHWSAPVFRPVTQGIISFTHACKNWIVFDDECEGCGGSITDDSSYDSSS